MDTPITDQTALEKERASLRKKQKVLTNVLNKLRIACQKADPDDLKGLELQYKIASKQDLMVSRQLKDLGPTPKATTIKGRLEGIVLGTEQGTIDQALKAAALLMNKEGSEQTDDEPDWDGISDDE